MGDYLVLAISCILINNILLAQYLGNCPFLGNIQENGNRHRYGHGGYLRSGPGRCHDLGGRHLCSQKIRPRVSAHDPPSFW
jgi:hypothetical protein